MGKVKNRFAKPAKKGPIVTPSANNWESISDEVRQAAITMGYTKESWNNMTEDEKTTSERVSKLSIASIKKRKARGINL